MSSMKSSSSSHYSTNRAQILKSNAVEEKRKVEQKQSSSVTKSSWTPLSTNHKLKEKLFCERKDLVSNWFDKWNDVQRKAILHLIIEKCTSSQRQLIDYLVHPQIPVLQTDFSRILPRCIVVYIFSFLDPRSLCRCARVSWYFKFVSEADECWMPKCINLGWWPNFKINSMEIGVWKRLFVESIVDLRNGRLPASNAKFDQVEEQSKEDVTKAIANQKKETSKLLSTKNLRKNDSKKTGNIDTQRRRRKVKQLHPLRPNSLADQTHQNERKEIENSSETKPTEIGEDASSATNIEETKVEFDGRPLWAQTRYLNSDYQSNSTDVKTPGLFLQDLMYNDIREEYDSDPALFSARPWHIHQENDDDDDDDSL